MGRGFFTISALILALTWTFIAASADNKKWNPEGLFDSREFSHVVTSDPSSRIVFISSQAATLEDGSILETPRIRDQIRQILKNLQKVLGAVGADPADVVSMHIYVRDYRIGHGMLISAEMRRFFNFAMPASSFIPVVALCCPGALVEVDAVAIPHR
jgi:enamine deaminase RidA (YjgF/YER057c/UK114 family)